MNTVFAARRSVDFSSRNYQTGTGVTFELKSLHNVQTRVARFSWYNISDDEKYEK
jgi:hypothetical protein